MYVDPHCTMIVMQYSTQSHAAGLECEREMEERAKFLKLVCGEKLDHSYQVRNFFIHWEDTQYTIHNTLVWWQDEKDADNSMLCIIIIFWKFQVLPAYMYK